MRGRPALASQGSRVTTLVSENKVADRQPSPIPRDFGSNLAELSSNFGDPDFGLRAEPGAPSYRWIAANIRRVAG
jgi:hypothetical protein